MSIEPGGPLERALDNAVLRHPAARRGLGFHRVELAPLRVVGDQLVPPVYALECLRCGVLFRVGSPHLVAHHEGHRGRSPLRRIRRLFYRADRWVRALFGATGVLLVCALVIVGDTWSLIV